MTELKHYQAPSPRMVPPPTSTFPLSTAQRGQWLAQKLHGENTAFNVAEYLDIQGPLNTSNFLLAIQQLIKEADCTRSRIIEESEQTAQFILPDDEGDVSILDVSNKENPHAAACQWMHEDMRRPLNKPNEALWCSALIKIAHDHYYWYQRCHHAALDGFSGNLIAQRLSEIYNSLEEGREIEANPFGSIADILRFEADYKTSKRYIRDRNYWLENLAHLPDPVSLSQRIEPSGLTALNDSLHLSQALAEQLASISQSYGASQPQALIALVAAYFYRMTGAEDLVFAMPVTARISRQHRQIPGMMANAVPIRLSMSTTMTLGDLIQQVSQVVLKALRHQQYRYEDLKRDFGLISSGQQIASLGINIEPFDYNLTFGRCTTTLHNLSNAPIEDLTAFIFDRHDHNGLKVTFDANPDRYTAEELKNHLAQFERMAKDAIAHPDRPISQASLLSPDTRHKMLSVWNDTQWPIPNLSVVDLFDAQVMRTPEAIAVADKAHSLSYIELNRQANAWAHRLRREGVGPHDLVAIALNRNIDMLVALLATLKAGAAYLPLDPDFPADRIRHILEDAQPKLVISTHHIDTQDIHAQHDAPTLWIDQPDFDIHNREYHNHPPQVPITEGHSAYVIYTSGSTGRPKGVEIPHKALTNFLYAMQIELKLTASDRFLAVTTISFDISVLELFLPLTVGASVLIVERNVVRSPEQLTAFAVKHQATIMQATPSLWQALLPDYQAQWHNIQPLVGGEALQGQLAEHMAKLGHPVINLFGPTETTIWSTIMPLEKPADLQHPPIGRPILNTQVYVLDKAMQLVPIGVSGDLYIAGEGLAVGYYKRPELTGERFLPNPFDPGSRLYITGDQARWREDGVLEYLGRDDHQVKIRGFRIETGDIEARLLACREIQQAVVVAQPTDRGDKQLVAYIVPVDDTLKSQEIREELVLSLPDYMVPNYYVMLDALPLTPNGKINRKALPKPAWRTLNAYTAPRNALEETLATLWSTILGVTKVGIHDNFFEIGGDSINATMMINQVKQTLSLDIPLGILFKSPTIADISDHFDTRQHYDPLAHILSIRTEGSEPPLFCIHPALGLSLGYANLLRYLPSNIPLYGLQADGLHHAARLPTSIEEMADDYITRIRSIQPQGPYRLLGWSFGGLVAHAIAEKLQASGAVVDCLCMLDSYPYQLGVQAPTDEAEVIAAALAFLGYDLSTLEDLPQDKQALAQFLWQDYDDSSMTVIKEIQKQKANIIEHIEQVIHNNLAIANHFLPGKVDANLLFFVAEGSMNGAMGNILEHEAEAWESRISGSMEVHHIHCHHQAMLDPEPLNHIGPIIGEYLSRISQSE
ncbi:hypothetical protein BFW38_14815 [Terasakiispira papahanaumokuakeensis]|uniref:Carrier domain-containing protein n=1 Tax=Terasakiispira papahanaumokuakeensis TaxID=197479 RepID=A0A1E2VC91_9GAMM|nr:non-ribosomal peptide synthetase [Terasakiispira papahanaumokuakeensis]ODC04609.1 hypothetical protein BFW38_14815 [Terasakiispira papahanaumokuakeensis]